MRAKMNLKDGAGLFGIFDMSVYDIRNGKRQRIRHVHKRNQITNQGREALLDLMRPETNTPLLGNPDDLQRESKIWSLSVGTYATPPTINDTDATMTQVWRSQFALAECQVVVIAPNQYYLQIGKVLPSTPCSANGYTLTEAGVFTRGDSDDPVTSLGRKLYARQVHPPIIKTATMTIEYDWKLGITIQGA